MALTNFNMSSVEELRDSTAHAEVICIREASNILRTWRLSVNYLSFAFFKKNCFLLPCLLLYLNFLRHLLILD